MIVAAVPKHIACADECKSGLLEICYHGLGIDAMKTIRNGGQILPWRFVGGMIDDDH
jgi:hypothetical protein